jgi:hypothetical protein
LSDPDKPVSFFRSKAAGPCKKSQTRQFEERYPNGRFLIRKQSLREVPVKGRSWPKIALRRHCSSDRLCHSHEGPESTQIGHSSSLS